MDPSVPEFADAYPWYRSHARAAVVLSAGLFVAVTAFHVYVNGTGEAVDILYALPIALLAMSFGLRGGLTGAAVGFSPVSYTHLTLPTIYSV